MALSPWDRWETPLGDVPVDTGLGDNLAARVPGLVPDPEAHRSEHSLEVQLPFLYHLYGSRASIIPICVADQSIETARGLGRELGNLLAGRSALVLASSDFSHYVPDSVAREEDSHALESITAVDIDRLADVLDARGPVMCGYGPVMAMLVALRTLGAKCGRVLAYATSGDISGDKRSVVGYAAVEVLAQRGDP